MSYSLPVLPYDYTALEPFVDTKTMHLHHTAHHQAYINNLNKGLQENASIVGAHDLIAIQRQAAQAPAIIRNNGGGHYNHSLFWKWMAPPGSANVKPHGELAHAIDQTWGSFEEMKKAFTQAALTRFGSGWAWLGVTPSGKLAVTSTANQDNPLMKGLAGVEEMIPILGLDVWEHAYYLNYQNRRPEYVEKWWNVVNWDEVVQYYDQYASKQIPVPI